jgi:hypothetical protein
MVLLKRRVQRGLPCKPLETYVEPHPVLYMYWEGFWHLNSTRTAGFSSMNPVSISEIKAYCEMRGISDTQFFLDIVLFLDREYIRNEVKKSESKNGRKHNTYKD